MQTAKSITPTPTPPVPSRVASHATAVAARRAKRLAALNQLTPQIEALTADAKEGGLGLIGYFLDMALYEARREQDLLSEKAHSA
jgi:hypothetical protein